jgi:protein SSD1
MHAPGPMAPPPAPSAGSNTHVFDTYPGQINPPNVNTSPSRRGGHTGGHARRHSLALTEAKERAAARQQANSAQQFGTQTSTSPTSPTGASDTSGLRSEYTGSTSSFLSPPNSLGAPPNLRGGLSARGHSRSQSAAVPQNRGVSPHQFPSNAADSQSNLERRGSLGSGHQRSGSRSDSNWRQPQESQPAGGLGASQHAPATSYNSPSSGFGHTRGRGSIGGSFSGFP